MSIRSVVALAVASLGLAGCRESRPEPARPAATAPAPVVTATEAPPQPLHRCFPEEPAWVDAPVRRLLARAADKLDHDDDDSALACAEEAARQAPHSVEAHQDRADALVRLGRLDDAREAMTLALALAPDDTDLLEAAADLYVNRLAQSAARSAIGLEYARRGSAILARRSRRQATRQRAAALALLEGQALTDLGRASEALPRITTALALDASNKEARYDRGVALFELCRLAEARRAFERVVADDPGDADALYHLALIDERDGHESDAARHFAAATAALPDTYPPPPDVSPESFAERVHAVVAALPDDLRADLGGVAVEAAELPALEDLVAEKPPLSPTILGLFRGSPLGSDSGCESTPGRARASGRRPRASTADAQPSIPAPPPRSIVLYRKNLLRTVHDQAELDRAITRTLLHEIGHLRGEDDGSLRDRGLE
jgi:tetratricopeptide (TPR) repeat protein